MINNEEHIYIYIYIYIYKYKLILLFVNSDACVEQKSNQRESLHTLRSHQESELPLETDFSPNSRSYIVLRLTRDLQVMLVFHWSRLTPMHWLFFIGCFSLVMAYTHALLAFHLSWLSSCFSLAMIYTYAMFFFHLSWLPPMHSLFPVSILLILSTVKCICQKHLSGSLQVKVIYYNINQIKHTFFF